MEQREIGSKKKRSTRRGGIINCGFFGNGSYQGPGQLLTNCKHFLVSRPNYTVVDSSASHIVQCTHSTIIIDNMSLFNPFMADAEYT